MNFMCLGLLVLITVNPLLSLQGGLFISNTFEEVLNRDREVYIVYQRRWYQVEKLRYKKLEGMQLRIQHKSKLPAGA